MCFTIDDSSANFIFRSHPSLVEADIGESRQKHFSPLYDEVDNNSFNFVCLAAVDGSVGDQLTTTPDLLRPCVVCHFKTQDHVC